MTRASAVSTQHQCERLAAQRLLGVRGLLAGVVVSHAMQRAVAVACWAGAWQEGGQGEGAWR